MENVTYISCVNDSYKQELGAYGKDNTLQSFLAINE